MAISRFLNEKPLPPSKVKAVVKTLLDPITVSHRKFYQSHPEEAVFVLHVSGFILLTFVGEFFMDLPWYWYALLLIWMVSFHLLHSRIGKSHKEKNAN